MDIIDLSSQEKVDIGLLQAQIKRALGMWHRLNNMTETEYEDSGWLIQNFDTLLTFCICKEISINTDMNKLNIDYSYRRFGEKDTHSMRAWSFNTYNMIINNINKFGEFNSVIFTGNIWVASAKCPPHTLLMTSFGGRNIQLALTNLLLRLCENSINEYHANMIKQENAVPNWLKYYGD